MAPKGEAKKWDFGGSFVPGVGRKQGMGTPKSGSGVVGGRKKAPFYPKQATPFLLVPTPIQRRCTREGGRKGKAAAASSIHADNTNTGKEEKPAKMVTGSSPEAKPTAGRDFEAPPGGENGRGRRGGGFRSLGAVCAGLRAGTRHRGGAPHRPCGRRHEK